MKTNEMINAIKTNEKAYEILNYLCEKVAFGLCKETFEEVVEMVYKCFFTQTIK